MQQLISIEGINQALSHLHFKPNTQKAMLLEAIRSRLADIDSLKNTSAIPPDILIKEIWDTEDPDEVIKRKKSLSSLKSALNKSLKELAQKDQNPEGIIINRDNIFEVSEDRKNDLLKELGLAPGADSQVTDLISSLKEMLPQLEADKRLSGLKDLFQELEQSKEIIKEMTSQLATQKRQITDLNTRLTDSLSGNNENKSGEKEIGEEGGLELTGFTEEESLQVGVHEFGKGQEQDNESQDMGEKEGPGKLEEIEVDDLDELTDDEEIEEVELDDSELVDEQDLMDGDLVDDEVEEIVEDGDFDEQELEEIEVDDLEEATDHDEFEGVEVDDIGQLGDDQEIEEVEEDEIEEVEVDDLNELGDDDEIEKVELDDAEIVDEQDLMDDVLVDDEVEELVEDDDFEAVDDQGLEEVEIDDLEEDEIEEVEVDDLNELGDDDEIEEVELDDSEIVDEQGLIDGDLVEDEVETLVEDDDIEALDDQDLEEVEVNDLEEATDHDKFEEVEVDDIDELAEDQDVEEVELDDADLVGEQDLLDGDLVDDEVVELVEDDDFEAVDDQDLEEIEVDDLDEVTEDEEFEEVELDDTELVDELDLMDGDFVDDEVEELVEDDNFEAVDDQDLEEVEVNDLEEAIGQDEIEEIEIDDLEEDEIAENVEEVELDDTELVDEQDLMGGELVDDEVEEVVEDDDFEAVDDQDLEEIEVDDLDEDEIEEVEVDDLNELGDDEEIEEVELGEGERLEVVGNDKASPKKLMEVLSKYMDPEEALDSDHNYLKESEEGLIGQLLERFTPKFIKIPSGQYQIGSRQPAPDEHPIQSIHLQSFYIGQLPVTNDIFDLFIRETGYQTDAEKAGFGTVHQGRCSSKTDPVTGRTSLTLSRDASTHQIAGANWRHPSGPGSDLDDKANHPVVQVSRRDAMAFAAWAGKRLPTEEEWEAATRGQNGLAFPWGDQWQASAGNFASSFKGGTVPVDCFCGENVSPFGIYDLLGNIYEWTSTIHQSSNTNKAHSSHVYVLKGGCWNSSGIITACHRITEKETWSNIIGFRCAV